MKTADLAAPRATPLPIAEGGTNATNATQALVNLGVPTGTIEVVQGGPGILGYADFGVAELRLEVPVTVARGGTNATTAATARTQLQAAGTVSPQFTGIPRAPTPTGATPPLDQIANVEYVQSRAPTITRIDAGYY